MPLPGAAVRAPLSLSPFRVGAYKSASDSQKSMRIGTYLGEIGKHITFRLSVNGDDWAGASYFVLQI
jgi:hypothetical protein